ncbi:MAG TPA: crotonase/enoyl-CoA hydratase family protein [Acidimicrobiia bacterium]
MTVSYERRGQVAVITIDRPDVRNAVDRATAAALGEAWRRFEVDQHAHVGILHGRGGNFSSGADLKAFDLEDGPDGFLGFTRMQIGKPTIAAVEGYCVAGGLEMALWCDLRIAGASAVFGCFERRFGVPLVDGGTQRLPRIVGLGLALEMILTGRSVEAEEAHAIGLVNTVVSDGDTLAYAVMMAERIAASPQDTLRSDRMAVLDGLGRPIGEGLELERHYGFSVMDVAARGAVRFTAGAGRAGTPVPPLERAPEDDASPGESEEPSATEEIAEPVRHRIPAAGLGRGALVVDGPGADRMAERMLELGFVVEVLDVGPAVDRDRWLSTVTSGIEDLLDSGVVVGEQVAMLVSGHAAGTAIWASTIETRIGAVVIFGMASNGSELQPQFRMADASYIGHQGGLDPALDDVKPSVLEITMRDVGLDATFHVYRNGNARFYDPTSPDHDQALEDLAWQRTELFLERAF